MDLNRTDIKILEFASRIYRNLSCIEIAKNIKLHKTTVYQRLNILHKNNYLKKIGKGRLATYRYNFLSDHARKLRLFLDSQEVCKLNNDKIKKFIEKHRINENILTCLLYGSVLATKNFNDIDLLIVYKNEKPIIKDIKFDILQIDAKTFRELYSLGEPRLQAALANGRIIIDREFVFNYFENDLPIIASEEIINELDKKYEALIKIIETGKEPLDELKKLYSNVLEIKAILYFAKNRIPIPTRLKIIDEIKKYDEELAEKMENIKTLKSKKDFWNVFYSS